MTVSLIFDIVLVLLGVFIIIRNAARGFIRSLMTLVKTILAPFVAIIFNMPVARIFSNKIFMGISQKWISNLLYSAPRVEEGYELYKIADGIPNWLINKVVGSGLDEETLASLDYYFIQENVASKEQIDSFTTVLGGQLSLLISVVVSFILLFVVAEILFLILGALLNKASKISIIKFINIILGALVGAVIAAVVLWLISLGLVKVFEFGAHYYEDIFKMEYIDQTVIAKFFKENNLWYLVRDYIALQ